MRPGFDNGFAIVGTMDPENVLQTRKMSDGIGYIYKITNEDIGAFGGAICFWKGSPAIELGETVLVKNFARSGNRRARGGAISLRSVEKATKISECLFGYDNQFGNTAEGLRRASGGAIDLFEAKTQIEKTKFYNNSVVMEKGPDNLPTPGQPTLNHVPDRMAYGGAIALHSGGSISEQDTELVQNSSKVCAGAIGFVGKSEAITGEGSAVFDRTRQRIDLKNCKFIGNQSEIHGGAIAGASSLSSGAIEKCKFIGNKVVWEESIDADGGAISFQVAGQLEIKGSSFVSNQAEDGGGAIKTGGNAKVSLDGGCSFYQNTSRGSGGAVRASTFATVDLTGVTFTGNETENYEYEDSFSELSGDGGAIALDNSFLKAGSSCTFRSNVAGRSGGAVSTVTKATGYTLVDIMLALRKPKTTLSTAFFTGNSSSLGGGAIAAKLLPDRASLNLSGRQGLQLLADNCFFNANSSDYLDAGTNKVRKDDLNMDIYTDGILAENIIRQKLELNLKSCSFKNQRGAVLLINRNTDTKLLSASISSNCKFEGCKHAITSRHADMKVTSAQFSYPVVDSKAVDVLILDTPKLTSLVSFLSEPNNQSVEINSCAFSPNKKATGVLVVREEHEPSKLNIQLRRNNFAGRQLTPPPNLAPLRADNGAVVVWDKPTNEVDAEQNYWDHRDGPFAFGNNNKEGSYASIYVNYRKWLKRAP